MLLVVHTTITFVLFLLPPDAIGSGVLRGERGSAHGTDWTAGGGQCSGEWAWQGAWPSIMKLL